MDATPERMQRQVTFIACYFAIYVAYLFVYPEGELLHWLTLVLLPLAGLAAIGPERAPRPLMKMIGLDPPNATRGFGWMLLFGAAFQLLQLLNRRQRAEVLAALDQPLGFLLPLGGLILLVGTVATTEEVFFRGVFQNRLAARFRSQWIAVLTATAAFAVYHIPYAYLNPAWPSAGDLEAAVRLALANGAIGGLALGFVYARSGQNLVAAIGLHALIDLIPSMRLVARLFAP